MSVVDRNRKVRVIVRGHGKTAQYLDQDSVTATFILDQAHRLSLSERMGCPAEDFVTAVREEDGSEWEPRYREDEHGLIHTLAPGDPRYDAGEPIMAIYRRSEQAALGNWQ